MNIAVIGGGIIVMRLAGEISRVRGFEVCVFSSAPELFPETMCLDDSEKSNVYQSGAMRATGNLCEAVSDADAILRVYPSQLREGFVSAMEQFVKPGAMIGFFPGYGGAEVCCGNLVKNGITIFSVQKAPYDARSKEKGIIAGIWSKIIQLKVAAISGKKTGQIAALIEDMLLIEYRSFLSYLCAMLLPGNPLLHSSESYAYPEDYEHGTFFRDQIYFYRSWMDECPRVPCDFSDELINICSAIPVDTSEVQSIQDYYESAAPEALTAKFHSIPPLQGLALPMTKNEGGYKPDFSSVFYVEDMLHGVRILKALALLTGTNTPIINMALGWCEQVTGKEYFVDDMCSGKDIGEASIPQRFGINSLCQFVELYSSYCSQGAST